MIESILKKLISFKTLSLDAKENKRALDWFRNQVDQYPVYTKELVFNNHPSLLVTTQKTKNPKIWLQGHMDVVPGPADLFRAQVKSGKIIGRGAFDMKFAIACYLHLVKNLGKQLQSYDFGIMLTSDEEMGGMNGVKKILEKGYGSKACILPDGGAEEWQFEKTAKGIWQIKVKASGESAHSSRPWEGSNAIQNLCRFIDDLSKKFPQEPCGQNDHFHNTINVGYMQGGEVINKIPNEAEAWIDIRFNTKSNHQTLKALVNKVRKNHSRIKIEEIVFANSYSLNTKNHYINSFSEEVKKIKKITPGFSDAYGASDARFFSEKGIPVILIKPRGGEHHGRHEWIDIKDLNYFYDVIEAFIKKETKI